MHASLHGRKLGGSKVVKTHLAVQTHYNATNRLASNLYLNNEVLVKVLRTEEYMFMSEALIKKKAHKAPETRIS